MDAGLDLHHTCARTEDRFLYFSFHRLWRVGGAGGDPGARGRLAVAAPAGRAAGLRRRCSHAAGVHPAAGQLQGPSGLDLGSGCEGSGRVLRNIWHVQYWFM